MARCYRLLCNLVKIYTNNNVIIYQYVKIIVDK